jgi:hypothetical protein
MIAAVEIEIDGPHNENLAFRPLQRNVRGRFDMARIGEPMAKVKAADWPTPIPSQRLGIDPDGNGYLIEPLHDAEHAALREKIEKRGKRLEPKVQEFAAIDVPSWLYWMKSAVEAGLARVTKGKLPAKIEGDIRKDFILAKPDPNSTDKLTAALTEQAAAFRGLTDAILKLVNK